MVYVCIKDSWSSWDHEDRDFISGQRYIIEERLEFTLVGWYSICNIDGSWICNLPEDVIKRYFISVCIDRRLKLSKLSLL